VSEGHGSVSVECGDWGGGGGMGPEKVLFRFGLTGAVWRGSDELYP
jgi:hypothetical protein